MALTHTLGYPRIGENRELKTALEGFWSGKISQKELHSRTAELRQSNRNVQAAAGIDIVPSNDFSLYDHVLDTSALVGAVPERFEHEGQVDTDTYFALARGVRDSTNAIVAEGLRKWFDTNYHYLVPEFRPNQSFELSSTKPFDEFREAKEQNLTTKPVLLGPVSFLQLGKAENQEFDRLSLLPNLLPVYEQILHQLHELGAEWVQIDEPTLVLDLTDRERAVFQDVYEKLKGAAGTTKLLLGTYFGDLRGNLDTALALPVNAVHLDATKSDDELIAASDQLREDQSLSVGIVDGRNIWANDLATSLKLLQRLEKNLGTERLLIAPSSSLLHVPINAERESDIDAEVQSWLAFARQKIAEVVTLRDALHGNVDALASVQERADLLAERSRSSKRTNSAVQDRLATDTTAQRRAPFEERSEAQAKKLQLPPLPVTTIGSFPQTPEIRRLRADLRREKITEDAYQKKLRDEIAHTIRIQEEAGVDVLVHGEPERNDMVQYFADEFDGVATTKNGWVQSYGSRYVRPPIIYGDVSRPLPISASWSEYAQSLTERPVKGMLTGPVTILGWSFERDDIPKQETSRQIALTIRDEVRDLEQAGIQIIQVDEPAFREGLPLRKEDHKQYIEWATEAFRMSIATAAPETQIHSHMCYADFRDIVGVLKELDIDVISLEAARSRLKLVEQLDAANQPFEVGPGVWDVHSPHVPSQKELEELLQYALKHIPVEKLWVNPDCGLKTRAWEEVLPSLCNMVKAAKSVREQRSKRNTADTSPYTP